jgi:hypothetical protein
MHNSPRKGSQRLPIIYQTDPDQNQTLPIITIHSPVKINQFVKRTDSLEKRNTINAAFSPKK